MDGRLMVVEGQTIPSDRPGLDIDPDGKLVDRTVGTGWHEIGRVDLGGQLDHLELGRFIPTVRGCCRQAARLVAAGFGESSAEAVASFGRFDQLDWLVPGPYRTNLFGRPDRIVIGGEPPGFLLDQEVFRVGTDVDPARFIETSWFDG